MSGEATTHKFTLALRKNSDEQLLLEAAANAALALGGSAKAEDVVHMHLLEFEDASGWCHANISALSLIVMKAKVGELNRLQDSAVESSLLMRVHKDSAGDPLAVIVFGEKVLVNPMTSKLSLWR
ncbi:DUF2000 family protein [Aquabacterium sp. CECT 9606]|uniref:DUF2000 family protein n=1 Tax=Aquabacterium sp. CECT 9606 TaxID=2845822 RepID=UPI001E2DB4DF|nr:DUF2000 family protein [Aquabacterium sp. CECT 9606]CAH0353133.1 hypothetical protein AQB9606_03078 [Aquabacterium sp. CECT 9606]